MPTSPYLDLDSIHTPTVGGTPPATWGVAVRDNLETLARAPGCVVAGGAQNIINNAASNYSFTTADRRDTDGFHAAGSDQIVIPAGLGGWYSLAANITWDASAAGRRQHIFTVNSSGVAAHRVNPVTSGGVSNYSFTAELLLTPSDVVRLQVAQTSGGTLAATASLAVRLVAWP